jgi:hypothetical protein
MRLQIYVIMMMIIIIIIIIIIINYGYVKSIKKILTT